MDRLKNTLVLVLMLTGTLLLVSLAVAIIVYALAMLPALPRYIAYGVLTIAWFVGFGWLIKHLDDEWGWKPGSVLFITFLVMALVTLLVMFGFDRIPPP